MTRGKMLGLVVVGALSGGLGYAVWARADEPAPCPHIGKYILVHDRASQCVIPLERAELKTIGGKQFLVGIGARVNAIKAPGTGRPVWVNLEDANTIIHFDNAEDVNRAIQEGQPPRDH